jgi:hypothetical protein
LQANEKFFIAQSAGDLDSLLQLWSHSEGTICTTNIVVKVSSSAFALPPVLNRCTATGKDGVQQYRRRAAKYHQLLRKAPANLPRLRSARREADILCRHALYSGTGLPGDRVIPVLPCLSAVVLTNTVRWLCGSGRVSNCKLHRGHPPSAARPPLPRRTSYQ